MSADIYQNLKSRLHEAGIENSDLEARIILQKRAGIAWADIIAGRLPVLTAAQEDLVDGDVKRRIAGEPLSRIYGERQFWGLDFTLGPATLDPRPDTEILVEKALGAFKTRPPRRILDLGTGSGCIPIALLCEWPESYAVAIDKSAEALDVARLNARRHGVEGRIAFICGDWTQSVQGKFDLIVSNPPYIANPVIPNLAKEVRNHDPILALDGGQDGLDAYKKIFPALFSVLETGGKSFFEIGFDQKENVMRLAEESGLSVIGVHVDYAGLARVVEISCGDK